MKRTLIALALLLVLLVVYFMTRGPIAESINKKGQTSYQNEEFAQAENYFKRALKLYPKHPESMIFLIKTQLMQDKTEEAKTQLTKLKNRFPELAETLALEGRILVIQEEFENSVPLLTEAIAADSLLAYAYFYRGIALANLGQLEAAADDYLKAQQIDQTNTDALRESAILMGKLENFEAAIQNYNALIELDPSNIDAYMQRGNFKTKIGSFESAADDFSKVIEINDALGEAYFNRGKSYAQWGKYANALSDFEKSVELNYKTHGARYNAGLASIRLGKNEKARNYFNQVISDENTEYISQAHYLLGVVNMMEQKTSAAIEHFNQSIKADQNNADAYYNRAIAFGMLEQYQPAISDLDKAIELGKTSSDVYFARGAHKISMHQTEAGCADLKIAEEMGNPQAKATRAKYCKDYME